MNDKCQGNFRSSFKKYHRSYLNQHELCMKLIYIPRFEFNNPSVSDFTIMYLLEDDTSLFICNWYTH